MRSSRAASCFAYLLLFALSGCEKSSSESSLADASVGCAEAPCAEPTPTEVSSAETSGPQSEPETVSESSGVESDPNTDVTAEDTDAPSPTVPGAETTSSDDSSESPSAATASSEGDSSLPSEATDSSDATASDGSSDGESTEFESSGGTVPLTSDDASETAPTDSGTLDETSETALTDATTADETDAVPADDPLLFVVLGSSTAAGKNLEFDPSGDAKTWVQLYEEYLVAARPGSSIVNFAVAGYEGYHALPSGTVNPADRPAVDPARNITAALALMPDAILLSFPSAGKLAQGWTSEEILGTLVTIVDAASAANVPTWVTTPQPNVNIAMNLDPVLALLADFNAQFGAQSIDFWTPLAAADGSGLPDRILEYDHVHPNRLGHELLFQQVVAAEILSAIGATEVAP